MHEKAMASETRKRAVEQFRKLDEQFQEEIKRLDVLRQEMLNVITRVIIADELLLDQLDDGETES